MSVVSNRRQLVQGVAWSIPAVISTASIPAYAASSCPIFTEIDADTPPEEKGYAFSYNVQGPFGKDDFGNDSEVRISISNDYPISPVVTSTVGDLVLNRIEAYDDTSQTYVFTFDGREVRNFQPTVTLNPEGEARGAQIDIEPGPPCSGISTSLSY